jgi:hypothetical protein
MLALLLLLATPYTSYTPAANSAAATRSAVMVSRRPASEVSFSYATSPFTDYLYYLLYRNVGFQSEFHDLKKAVPLDGIAPFTGGSFLPQDATNSNVTSYEQLYALAEKHDNPAALKELLHQGEPHFPAFLAFWKAHIEPVEDSVVAQWRQEQRTWPPVAHLEAMERLNFPFKTMRIDVFALQDQGGSMQAPPTIFSTPAIPGLAWAIGHEGTHMILEKTANWTNRPGGPEAVRLMTKAGGSEYAVEEALCLLMQAKMSIAAGETPPNFRTSTTIADNDPSKRLLIALERDWPAYLRNKKLNAADFLIEETIKTYRNP